MACQKNTLNILLLKQTNVVPIITAISAIKKWGQADNYDLVLNTSKISIENAAEVIKTYILLKQLNK